MEHILQWGLGLIHTVQSAANPGLTVFMKAVTNFGAAFSYMLVLPILYWCIDTKKGSRLGFGVMASVWINFTLKFLLKQPRPFWPGYDPDVAMISESRHGFPSGHAQMSLTMWTIIASWFKKPWAYAAAIFITLVVGFSRVYLGVHFPTDLAGGWILGALVLTVYFLCTEKLAALLAGGGMRVQIVVTALASFVMILYNPASAKEMTDGVQSLVMPGGIMMGMGAGYSIMINKIHFDASKVFGRKGAAKFLSLAARFVTGMAGAALVFVMFRMVMRSFDIDDQSSWYRMITFLQFAALEMWMYAGAPVVFQVLKLAEKPDE